MRVDDIRRTFLSFFAERGHRVVPSSSLIPKDPTMLLTTAGMVQFKPFFLGQEPPPSPTAASVQKCFRTTDIEEVGNTTRHHTFFEMLGNFSFGDYFKRDAIRWAWELSIGPFGLEPERIWATIYEEDDEAAELWLAETDVPAERIQRLGREDNFWWMHVAGPGGPNSELHYDRGPEYGEEGGPAVNGERYLEYYNLVFMQYEMGHDGAILRELPAKNVDTGMGLERVASLLQGVDSNYEVDVLAPVMERAEAITGARRDGSVDDVRLLRVLTDHARAAAFLVADGVVPTNEGRGYVLRRVMRRAVTRAHLAGTRERVLVPLCETVVAQYGDTYPELRRNQEAIAQVVGREEQQFADTLERGLGILEEEAAGAERISGELAFRLYDTYGFPLEITREVAAERGLGMDAEGFERLMEEQRTRSRRATDEDKAAAAEVDVDAPPTVFLGYDSLEAECEVLGIAQGLAGISRAAESEEVDVVFDRTPFYPEGGGQVGDRGWIEGPSVRAEVLDTRPQGALVLHRVRVTNGELSVGDRVLAQVSGEHRAGAERAHTATHMLHQTLRDVLGGHVRQMGSLVEPGRLRFDFSHFSAVPRDVLEQLEETVNGRVLADDRVRWFETGYREAVDELGATAFFEEKYGDVVRVVEVGDYSRELCGGTHVPHTGEVGVVKVLGEGSIGSNLRRIEALTGLEGLRYVNRRLREAERAAELARVSPDELAAGIERLLRAQKDLQRQLDELQRRSAQEATGELLDAARETVKGKILVARRDVDMKTLEQLAVSLRDRLGRAVVVLGRADGSSTNLVGAVSKELVAEGVDARAILRAAAAHIGGGAGGREDLARAGGRDPSGLERALAAAEKEAEGALA